LNIFCLEVGAQLDFVHPVHPINTPLDVAATVARLANTLLKDEESTRDNHVLACNFAKYSPILNSFSLADSAINVS